MRAAHDGSTSQRLVTVFGGTGYIGAEVVRQAQQHGFEVRVVTRSGTCANTQVECVALDLARVVEKGFDVDSLEHNTLETVVRGATAVVNCISLWDAPHHEMERLHVEGATALAAACHRNDVPLVHLSGLGAEAQSSDAYLRVRGQGDAAVYRANPHRNTVLRPGAIIGGTVRGLLPAFVMLAKMRLCPLFGFGDTMMQPVTLHDLAQTVVKCCNAASACEATHSPIIDVVGNELVSFREVLTDVARHMELRIIPVPLPYPLWSVVAKFCASLCTAPPIAPAQVVLMRSPTALLHVQPHTSHTQSGEERHGRLWRTLWGKQGIPLVSSSSSAQQHFLPAAVTMQEAFGITPQPIGTAITDAFKSKAS